MKIEVVELNNHLQYLQVILYGACISETSNCIYLHSGVDSNKFCLSAKQLLTMKKLFFFHLKNLNLIHLIVAYVKLY